MAGRVGSDGEGKTEGEGVAGDGTSNGAGLAELDGVKDGVTPKLGTDVVATGVREGSAAVAVAELVIQPPLLPAADDPDVDASPHALIANTIKPVTTIFRTISQYFPPPLRARIARRRPIPDETDDTALGNARFMAEVAN